MVLDPSVPPLLPALSSSLSLSLPLYSSPLLSHSCTLLHIHPPDFFLILSLFVSSPACFPHPLLSPSLPAPLFLSIPLRCPLSLARSRTFTCCRSISLACAHSLCCSALQCVAVRYSLSRSLSLALNHSLCCSVLQCVAVSFARCCSLSRTLSRLDFLCQIQKMGAVCCNVPQCVVICCSVSQ